MLAAPHTSPQTVALSHYEPVQCRMYSSQLGTCLGTGETESTFSPDACILPTGAIRLFRAPARASPAVRAAGETSSCPPDGAAAIDWIRGNVAAWQPTPHPILRPAARQSPPPVRATPASRM